MTVVVFRKRCDACRSERLDGRQCKASECLCRCHRELKSQKRLAKERERRN